MASTNPLRYRGYYYDTETGFYYLQSRYYDPLMHRFINPDSYAGTGQGILGYNMFTYCGNNPVRRVDCTGCGWLSDAWNWVCDMAEDIYEGGKEVVESVATVIVDTAVAVYDYVTNDSEETVLNSDLPFAFYKGRIVIKLPIGKSAFSYGAMFIGTGNQADENVINTVKHEYGHTVQMERYGLPAFTIMAAIPSLYGYYTDVPYDQYYNQPWEYEADYFGGVVRDSHTTAAARYRPKYAAICTAVSSLVSIVVPF